MALTGADTYGIDPAAGHPERTLALGYAPPANRPALEALFALDTTLSRLALGTRDALTAQLRLTWWHEALTALHEREPPAQPILRALAGTQVDADGLARMTDAWQRVLAGGVDVAAFAAERGALFVAAAGVLAAGDDVTAAGAGWALADLARLTADPALRGAAEEGARPLLDRVSQQRWSVAGRVLGALALSARADLAGHSPPGSPRRVARLAWHRLTGR